MSDLARRLHENEKAIAYRNERIEMLEAENERLQGLVEARDAYIFKQADQIERLRFALCAALGDDDPSFAHHDRLGELFR